MPIKAKYYAYSVIGSGALVFAVTIWNWASPNKAHFLIYFALALIASTVKFKLPGITGTYSASFLFTLVGIAGFTLPETLAASCAGALVQSVWRAKQRPSVIQGRCFRAPLHYSSEMLILLIALLVILGFVVVDWLLARSHYGAAMKPPSAATRPLECLPCSASSFSPVCLRSLASSSVCVLSSFAPPA